MMVLHIHELYQRAFSLLSLAVCSLVPLSPSLSLCDCCVTPSAAARHAVRHLFRIMSGQTAPTCLPAYTALVLDRGSPCVRVCCCRPAVALQTLHCASLCACSTAETARSAATAHLTECLTECAWHNAKRRFIKPLHMYTLWEHRP